MTDRNSTNNTEQYTTGTSEVTQFFDSLKRPERRAVLLYLREPDTDTADLDELSEYVSNRLAEEDEAAVGMSLYHCHLPRLADSGLIHYDRERGVVSGRDGTNELLNHLVE